MTLRRRTRPRTGRRGHLAVSAIMMAGLTTVLPPAAHATNLESNLLTETFTHATADPRFEGFGAACLTGAPEGNPGSGDHTLGGCPQPEVGPVPPINGDPDGYLQLTDAGNDMAGAALFNEPIPADHGLEVSFEQWQYGGTQNPAPADGISFFLVNGTGGLTAPGAFGGSLGYAQKLPDDDPTQDFIPGVDNGYMGIGLDVLGNYFGDWEHRGNGCPPGQRSPAGTGFRVPAPGPNMVTVRGPGNGTNGYCFLTATTSNFTTTGPWPSTLPGQLHGPLTNFPPGTTPAQAAALLEPSKRTVTVKITPAPDPEVTVDIDFNDGHGAQQVLAFDAPPDIPPTYKFGFAASTGLFTDVHLIRNLHVETVEDLPELSLVKQISQDPPLPPVVPVGTELPYEFVVTNTGTTTIDNLVVNDPMFSDIDCPVRTLAPLQSTTCTATHTVNAQDAARGEIRNTAIAAGTSDGERVDSNESSADIGVAAAEGSLDLEKQVDNPRRQFRPGDVVKYSYTVTNTSNTTIDDIRIDDNRVSDITCDSTTLSPAGTPGDSTTCRGKYTVTRADSKHRKVVNTAVAIGNDGQVVSGPAKAKIKVCKVSDHCKKCHPKCKHKCHKHCCHKKCGKDRCHHKCSCHKHCCKDKCHKKCCHKHCCHKKCKR